MTIGDTLSVSPANVTNATAQLFFQKPGAENENVLSLNFTNLSDIAHVATAWLADPAALAAIPGTSLNAVAASLAPILGTDAVTFQADVALSAGANYTGNGGDLRVFVWSGTNWLSQPFAFDSANHAAIVSGVTNLSAFAISQIAAPQLNIQSGAGGFTFQFTPVPNCGQALERSTDLVTWESVTTFTPTNAAPVILTDANAPADKAFYRVRVNVP